MRLIHPYVIDTSVLFNLRGMPGMKSKLRDLAFVLLGKKIQGMKNVSFECTPSSVFAFVFIFGE